jgi:lipopolysaccharide biosynthesis regulator YciM
MSKLSVFIFIIFLAVLALFAFHNQKLTTIQIPFGTVYETPTIALLLLSVALGALGMLVVFVLRDTKRYVDNIQFQKRQKKEARVREFYSKAVNCLLSHHDQNEAKQLLNQILVEDPDNLNALLRLGDIASGEDDFQKAREFYLKARELNPKNVEVLFSLVKLSEKRGWFDESLRYIEEILELDDRNLSALYKKREIFEKQEKWDELVFVQKAILKNERAEQDKERERLNLVGYKYEYGRHSLENGDLEKAKKAFRTVARLEKEFVPAALGLAEVLLREGETEEAINLLEKSYEQNASVILLLRLEDMLISANEPLRLIRIYKNNILKNPLDPVVKFFLARLYFRLEMIDDAFETIYSIDTGGIVYPELHRLLGDLHMKRNEPTAAAREFKKALDCRMPSSLSYSCSRCSHKISEWSGRCVKCREWSTYRVDLSPLETARRPVASTQLETAFLL